MRTRSACGWALLVAVSVCQCGFAQIQVSDSTQANSGAPVQPAVDAPAGSSIDRAKDESTEIQLLRSQVDAFKTFQSDLLSTVYFTLTTVAAITVALLGYSLFFNFRVYEQDKKRLVEEFQNALRDALTKSDSATSNRFEAESRRVDESIDRLRAESRSYVEEVLRREDGKLRQAIDKAEESALNALKVLDASLSYSIALTSMRTLRWRVEDEAEKGRYSLAATIALHYLEEALEVYEATPSRDTYFLEKALEAVLKQLEHGGNLSKHELEKLPELLSRIPDSLKDLRERMRGWTSAK